MNHLEKEIDSKLAEQFLTHKKLHGDKLSELINKLTTLFFSTETKRLDPYHLKNTKQKHDPEFWKNVDKLQNLEKPFLIVKDSKTHAWKLETSADLKMLFSETTGFPFWIADDNFKVLIYMDDHDCVYISDCTQ